MTPQDLKTASFMATAAVAGLAQAADQPSVDDLIARIKNKDDKVRGPAWQTAEKYGAPAVKPLAAVMTEPEPEVARAAQRGLWKIVRYAGRPNAGAEAKAVVAELMPLLVQGANVVRREVVWMLSELAGDEAIPPMSALLSHPELREDARCALTRMPGAQVTAVLKKALASAPEEFKFADRKSVV